MANVSIPWDTGERTIDLANIRLKKGQMEMSALGQLGAAAGTLIGDYRGEKAAEQALEDKANKDLSLLAQKPSANPSPAQGATPAGAAAQSNAASATPVNSSDQGNTNKVVPPTPAVDKQPGGGDTTDTRQVSSPGTGSNDLESSQQPGGNKPTGGPTNPNTTNSGPPPTADQSKTPPGGTAPPPDAKTPAEANALAVKATPQTGAAGTPQTKPLAELAQMPEKPGGFSRFMHRVGDIFGVSDPYEEQLHKVIAMREGEDEELDREAKRIGTIDTLTPKLINAEPLIRHFAPHLTEGLPEGSLKTYPPNYGRTQSLTMAALQYRGSQKNPDGTWADPAAHDAVTRIADEANGRAAPQITKILNDIYAQPDDASKLEKIREYQAAVQSGMFGHQPDAINAVLGQAMRDTLGISDAGIAWPGINQGGGGGGAGGGGGGGGGTGRAERNNNPGNIKEGEATKGLSGIVGTDPEPAADGGHFLKFDSPQSGFNAMVQLLKSPHYAPLTVEQGLRKWSGKGYGAARVGIDPSRTIGSLSEPELMELAKRMAYQGEGYRGTLPPTQMASPTPATRGGDLHHLANRKRGPVPSVTEKQTVTVPNATAGATPAAPPAAAPPKKKGPLPSITQPEKTASIGGLPMESGLIASIQSG